MINSKKDSTSLMNKPVSRSELTEERLIRKPRVALVCPGIGLVQRGYERFIADLFNVLQTSERIDVDLFKGAGSVNAREKVPFFLARNGYTLRHIPLHKLLGGGSHRSSMHVECLTLLIGMLPSLLSGRYDIIHTIDPPFARILSKFRNHFNLPFKVFHTEASDMEPCDYPPVDFIHQTSPVAIKKALAYGIPDYKMSLLPLGIHCAKFETGLTRSELREKYQVDESAFVVLCVAAVNRYHKRIDYLIEEFSQLEGNNLLWLDGSMDLGDPDLLDVAMQRLGSRCRITHVPSESIGELYNLADVKVLASTSEAFGLVVPEALSANTAVLVHDSPHFEWLTGNRENLVNMTQEGALLTRLTALRKDRSLLEMLRHPEAIRQRIDWKYLVNNYESLYIELIQSCSAESSW